MTPGGPADNYGIRPGDVITAMDHAPVSDTHELLERMKGRPVGKSLALEVMRRGKGRRISEGAAAWPEMVPRGAFLRGSWTKPSLIALCP